MKTLIAISILISLPVFGATHAKNVKAIAVKNSVAHVDTNKAQAVTDSEAPPTPKLSTDVQFDGHMVGGKTQSPMEALSVVENEKTIDDLIGVRKNFNDRSERAKGLR